VLVSDVLTRKLINSIKISQVQKTQIH